MALGILHRSPFERIPAAAGFEAHRGACRRNLERQRTLLARLSLWLYTSAVPGLAAIVAGTRVYYFGPVLIVLLGAELGHQAKQSLEREIEELPAAAPAAAS